MPNTERINSDSSPVTRIHSATVPEGRLLPGIHGLRGIAALAVVLFHLVHLAKISVPESFSFIASDFGKGVHLFFVISAFSLMYSTEHTMQRQTWATEYFIKRFFRIAPLFYCILAGMILWPLIKYHTLNVGLDRLLLNLTFTFGFAPWTGIVWAGWTVGVEMLFYACLPVLLLTVRSTPATLALVVISILVSYAARSTLDAHYAISISQYGYNWAYFSFAPNLCFFIFGIYAFRLAQKVDKTSLTMRWVIPVIALALLGTLFLTKPGSPMMQWKGDPIPFGVGFALLCLWQSARPNRWIANRVFEYIGERSYSVYLLHPVVIMLLKNPIQTVYAELSPALGAYAYFVCAALVLGVLILLAEATYRLIEIPGINWGRRLNSHIKNRARTSGSAYPS